MNPEKLSLGVIAHESLFAPPGGFGKQVVIHGIPCEAGAGEDDEPQRRQLQKLEHSLIHEGQEPSLGLVGRR